MNGTMTDPLSGKLYRDASGRLTLEVSGVKGDEYLELCRRVAEAFSLHPLGSTVQGLDVRFCDYCRGDQIVEVGWDIWTEFTVIAKSPSSEELVRQIASSFPLVENGVG